MADFWTLPSVPVSADELEVATVLRDALGYTSFIDLQRDALHWLCLHHKELLRAEHIPYPHPQLWGAGTRSRRRGLGRGRSQVAGKVAQEPGLAPDQVPAQGEGSPEADPQTTDPECPPASES
jgi:hypothetical protein